MANTKWYGVLVVSMVSRRSVLLGLGGVTAGAGAILNTGAFSSVEAQRVANVETAGDASALLQLTPLKPTVTQTGGTIQINLDGSSGGAPACDSTTTIANMVKVTNQGTQPVREILFGFSVSGATQNDGAVADALKIVSGGEVIDATETVNLLVDSGDSGASDDELAPGESFRFGMQIDLLGVSSISCIEGDPDVTLTIIANTTPGPGSGGSQTPTETPADDTPTPAPSPPILDSGGTIVYKGVEAVAGDNGETSDLAPSGVQVLGPPADLNGNGSNRLPYVKGAELRTVDSNGNTQTLVQSNSSNKPRTNKSLLATGTWNGSDTSVFYADTQEEKIYRVESSGTTTEVANPGNGTNAVLGTGDIDGDGSKELLFADSSQSVRYVDDDGSLTNLSNAGAGSNNGIGIGHPAEINGKVWAVLIDGSNQIKLVTEDGGNTTETIDVTNNGGTNPASKAPVTPADVDNDGDTEIVYVDTGQELRYLDDPLGTQSVKELNDSAGDTITAGGNLGVVSPK